MIIRLGGVVVSVLTIFIGVFLPICKSKYSQIYLNNVHGNYVTLGYIIPILILLISIYCIYKKYINKIINIIIILLAFGGVYVHGSITQSAITHLNEPIEDLNKIGKFYESMSSSYKSKNIPFEAAKQYQEAKKQMAQIPPPSYASGTYTIFTGYFIMLVALLFPNIVRNKD